MISLMTGPPNETGHDDVLRPDDCGAFLDELKDWQERPHRGPQGRSLSLAILMFMLAVLMLVLLFHTGAFGKG